MLHKWNIYIPWFSLLCQKFKYDNELLTTFNTRCAGGAPGISGPKIGNIQLTREVLYFRLGVCIVEGGVSSVWLKIALVQPLVCPERTNNYMDYSLVGECL